MKKDFPRNTVTPELLNREVSLEEDYDAEFTTNALIMDECYLQGKNLLEDFLVSEAKIDVDNNHK